MDLDLDKATLAELKAEFVRLAGVVTEAHNQRLQIAQVIRRREAAIASAVLKRMEPQTLEALRSALNAREALR